MLSNQQYLGEFWNPNNSNKVLSGVLYFENSNIFLKCFNTPIPETEYMYSDLNFHKPYPIIYGKNVQLENITLINLKLYSFKSKNLNCEAIYLIDFILFGKCFLEDLNKKNINYSYNSFYKINEFLKVKTLTWSNFFSNNSNYKLTLENIKPLIISENANQKNYFWHRLNVENASNPTDNFIKSDFFLNSSFTELINFQQLIEHKKAIESFFSIATATPQNTKQSFLRVHEIDLEIITGEIIHVREKYEKYYNQTVIQFDELKQKNFIPFDIWIENFKQIEHSYYLYVNAISNFQTLPLKNYFLNLFFCNESILKLLIEFDKPETIALAKIKKIIADKNIVGNDKDWLLSKFNKENVKCISYFNELEIKLEKVIKIIFNNEYNEIIRKAKQTRDSYVHKNKELVKDIFLDRAEILIVSNKLRVLFQANCLLYMGYNDEEISVMLFRYPSNSI